VRHNTHTTARTVRATTSHHHYGRGRTEAKRAEIDLDRLPLGGVDGEHVFREVGHELVVQNERQLVAGDGEGEEWRFADINV
jgi:hypothetical protein